MDTLVTGLLRTTAVLSVTAIAAWSLMKIARVSSPRSRRVVCCLILLQGWVFLRLPLDIPIRGWVAEHETTIAGDASSFGANNEVPPDSRLKESLSIATSCGLSSYAPWLIALWIGGMLMYPLNLVVRYLLFLRRLPPGRTCREEWTAEWERLLTERGVRRPIRLRMTTLIGPALCRLPRGWELLIPMGFWRDLAPEGRRAVLEHELAHYRRRDGLKSLLVRLLALPQWFNPVAWAVVRHFDECAEWACDQQAVGAGAVRPTEYANTLLRLSRFPGGHPSFSPAAHGRDLSVRVRRLVSCYSLEDSVMKRTAIIGTVAILVALCSIRVNLVAHEPAPYVPPSAARPAEPAPYRIEPPDIVEIRAFDKAGLPTIQGACLVGPDGTVHLKEHATVNLAGKTIPEAEQALALAFGQSGTATNVSVRVSASNSKWVYVVLQSPRSEPVLGGDSVIRLACTGQETAKDAMKKVPQILSANRVWITRPMPDGRGCVKLPVDVQAIQAGSAEKDWQLFPGDRLFVQSDGK